MLNFKKILKATACAAACVAALSGCTNYSKMMNETPQEYISLATENTTKAMVKGSFGEEYLIMQDAAKDGSFNLEFEVEGIKFSGECYANEKDAKTAQTYALTGSKGTTAEFYIFAGENGMKVGTSGNSGRHIYDVTFEGLAEKLAASIFAPDSGTEYALSQSDYDVLLGYAEDITAAIGGNEEQNKYVEIIDACIAEKPPVVEEKIDTDIGGVTANANIITYNIPKESLYALFEKYVDLMLEDYEISEEMAEYYSKEDMKKEYMSMLDTFEEYSLKITYYINSKTHVLMKSDIIFNGISEGEAGEIYIKALYGDDPANAMNQKFNIGMTSAEMAADVEFDIAYGENTTEINITAVIDEETTEVAKITSSKDGENYNITLYVPMAEMTGTVDGTIKTEKDSFTLTVDKLALVEGAGEVSYMPKGVISVSKGGAIPELEAEKEFLDITVDEMDALAENVENDVTAVLEEFAEDSPLAGSMMDYINKSKVSAANANSKMLYTAIATYLTKVAIDNGTISGTTVEGNGTVIVIDGKETDLSEYLGNEFKGYYYAEIDPELYCANFVVWSEEPIADEYKRAISYDEQETLAEQGTIIGCYPLG